MGIGLPCSYRSRLTGTFALRHLPFGLQFAPPLNSIRQSSAHGRKNRNSTGAASWRAKSLAIYSQLEDSSPVRPHRTKVLFSVSCRPEKFLFLFAVLTRDVSMHRDVVWMLSLCARKENSESLRQDVSTDAFFVIQKTAVGMVGSLPAKSFDVRVSTERSGMDRLLYSSMITGTLTDLAYLHRPTLSFEPPPFSTCNAKKKFSISQSPLLCIVVQVMCSEMPNIG